MGKISVVINTLNEEINLPRAISSVKNFADEIVVVDMNSRDKTIEIAEEAGAKVFSHKPMGYVEPARNFAIGKASGEWILILDADERLPEGLAKKLKKFAKSPDADYYRLPRKNIVFGRWLKYSRWWPDYNIRFFRKGKVTWNEVIHSVPMTEGTGKDLPAEEEYALLHYNYDSLEDYLDRMNRYSLIAAKNLEAKGYKFIWKDLIRKPLAEFLSRYFSGEGYKDGVHGLALAILQAFSEAILYLKVWQDEKFLAQGISLEEATQELTEGEKQLTWWIDDSLINSRGFIKGLPRRIIRKVFRQNR